MTRFFYSSLAFLWMIISCQSSAPTDTAAPSEEIAPAESAMEQQTFNDTVIINGRFNTSCEIPTMVKFREYNVMYSAPQEVAVNPNGEFSWRFVPKEPCQVTLRTGKTNYEFIVTPKEKTYNIEVTCSNGVENIIFKDSPENKAFREFYELNQDYNKGIESFRGKDLADKGTFSEMQKVLKDYREKISVIASSNPGTLTATMLCASETLPESWLNSPEMLRKNFLLRESLGNPQFYNTFLSSRIVMNYVDGIRDAKDTSFAMFSSTLAIAGKNREAAIRLQQVFHDLFYFRHEENHLVGFMKWAEQHPDALVNENVKASFGRLKKVVAGNPMIDFQLNDPNGELKKLSDVVASSKLTLLIFYSPTCSHCQEEIPQIVPLWEQYKNKGLKIFAVGFEATMDEWHWFIKNKVSEEWTHVFEPPDENPPSFQYVVNYTPTYVFITSRGKIVSRFPTIEDVKQDLANVFK